MTPNVPNQPKATATVHLVQYQVAPFQSIGKTKIQLMHMQKEIRFQSEECELTVRERRSVKVGMRTGGHGMAICGAEGEE